MATDVDDDDDDAVAAAAATASDDSAKTGNNRWDSQFIDSQFTVGFPQRPQASSSMAYWNSMET